MAETRAQIQAYIDEKISSLRRASLLRAILRIVRFGFDVASFAAGAMASGGATVIKTAFDAYYLLKDGLNLYDDLSQQAEARLAGFPNDPEIQDARAKLQAAHVDTEPARQLYDFLSSCCTAVPRKPDPGGLWTKPSEMKAYNDWRCGFEREVLLHRQLWKPQTQVG